MSETLHRHLLPNLRTFRFFLSTVEPFLAEPRNNPFFFDSGALAACLFAGAQRLPKHIHPPTASDRNTDPYSSKCCLEIQGGSSLSSERSVATKFVQTLPSRHSFAKWFLNPFGAPGFHRRKEAGRLGGRKATMSGTKVVHEAGNAVQKAEAVGSDYLHKVVVSEALLEARTRCAASRRRRCVCDHH